MNPSDPVSAAARFTAPAGWQRDTGSFGADHFVSFSSGTLRLRVQLLGAKGSRYATPKAFLAGPEAKSGGKAAVGRLTKVASRKLKVYERRYEAPVGDPGGMAAGSQTVEERFAVVPAGKSFFVLSFTRRHELPVEAPLDLGPWTAFLASFKPR
ncbi:MAG: hypothetical protein FD126_707 [Elusimicrobia bacterium]|nr:MAG: hypothetical protein FD126_707 [Elusimicrobiota bacterium]